MNQRGFGTLMIYGAIGAGVIILGLSIALKVQSARLESEKAEHQATKSKFDAFVLDTKRLGLEAQKRADEQKAKDKLAKEKADAQNRADRDRIAVLTRGLRDARVRANRDYLPAPAPGAKRSELATINRAELEAALQRFVERVAEGTERLLDEGDAATVDLNTVKRWAGERP